MSVLDASVKPLLRWGFHSAKRMRFPWTDFGDRRSAIILRFHSVSDAARRNHLYVAPSISLSPRRFERQIAFLAARYHFISMDQLLDALEGHRSPPRNAVVITLDDGYRDNYACAYPILRRYRVPATIYLTTGCLDGGPPLWTAEVRYLIHTLTRPRISLSTLEIELDVSSAPNREAVIRLLKTRLVTLPRREREEVLRELRASSTADPAFLKGTMLTWDDVREMRSGGMHFGAHTVTHPRLPSLPLEEAKAEIAHSRAELEARLRVPVHHFSYPNPGKGIHVNNAVKRLVRESGFRTAVTSRSGWVQAGDDRFELSRLASSAKPWGIPWDLEREALAETFRLPAARSSKSSAAHARSGGGHPLGPDQG